MKLQDSEVVFLLQLLFHVKASFGFGQDNDEVNQKISALLSKLESHVCSKSSSDGWVSFGWTDKSDDCEDDCHLNDCHEDGDEDEDDPDKATYFLTQKELLDLEKVRVFYECEKRSLKFVDGSKGMVDVDLDDGEEIICDVTKVFRKSDELHLETAAGWCVFDVQKFPKSWTAVLALDEVGELEEAKK